MHRTIEITVPAPGANGLVTELASLDDVVSLTLHRGASVKPAGTSSPCTCSTAALTPLV